MIKHLGLVFLVLLCSCTENKFPKYSKLDSLRILALHVDMPEIQNPAAGSLSVALTPYLSDVGGAGSLQLQIQSCLDPGVSVGALASCVGAPLASSIQSVTVSEASGAPMDTFGNPERTGKPLSGPINVALVIPDSLLQSYSPNTQVNGVSYLITVTAEAPTRKVEAFRRVLISTKTPNQNPNLSNLLSNGSPMIAWPEAKSSFGFSTTTAPENYTFSNGSGELTQLTEKFELSWFVSDGIIEQSRAGLNEIVDFEPGERSTGRQSIVVGVLRDDRGGTSVMIKKF